MKPVNKAETRTIHAQVIKEIGLDIALVLLGIGRDLRSGVIPPDNFAMYGYHCGTSHCIAGWAEIRTGIPHGKLFRRMNGTYPNSLKRLFGGNNPSDPQQAANAIERYVYDYDRNPWHNPALIGHDIVDALQVQLHLHLDIG